ncbi:hypothetical protein Goari_006674 [Gossypium aridum]|uniref:Uncharacterized protein n=1 Tax=Gossypium aridum TaxID=34290 RepID=A0A7J8XNT5_GOSAI|nr:hypothetical protein [Gossypium aridum]
MLLPRSVHYWPPSSSLPLEPVDKYLQEEYQEGSLLDHLKHHRWKHRSDTGCN